MEIRKIIKLNNHEKNQSSQNLSRSNSRRKSINEGITSIIEIIAIMYIYGNLE